MRIVTVTLVLLLSLAGLRAVADEGDPSPDVREPARAAWRWLAATAAYRTAVLKQARILREAAADDVHRGLAKDTSLAVLRRTSELHDRAETAFRETFEATAWSAWDPTDAADAEILRTGLDLAARHALETEPARAVSIWDHLMTVCPESVEARRARTTWLPIALPSTGDLGLARERLDALGADVDETWKPQLEVAVGDTYALEGDYEKARTHYETAREAIPDESDRNDPRGRLRGHLDLRLELVGKPVREVEGAEWLGEPPQSLAALRGSVLLLDVTSTWCGPCLKGMPHLDDLHRRYAERGFAVLALTRIYDGRGVIPESRDPRTGAVRPRELYRGEGRDAYVAHLRAFRERQSLSFPFLLVEKEVLAAAYPVTGLPTMLVVDRDGTIGFVAVGGMRHHLLELAVRRRLGDE